jgi:hypothetical protein
MQKATSLVLLLALFVLLGSATLLPAQGYAPRGKTSPTDEDVGKAVIKAFGALALHELAKPQRDDGIGEAIARAAARASRDKLIESAVQDLSPTSKPVERAAVRNLVILALDGQLDRDRDRVLAQLRRANPDMADAVEVTEFLIRLAQAIDRSK